MLRPSPVPPAPRTPPAILSAQETGGFARQGIGPDCRRNFSRNAFQNRTASSAIAQLRRRWQWNFNDLPWHAEC